MFDFIIIGGGLVGVTAALALAQSHGLKILVLEQKKPNTALSFLDNPYDFNQKTLAINHGTKLFFDKLGIWEYTDKVTKYLTPIKKVKVSMQSAFGQFQFTPPKKHEALGYIIAIKMLEFLLSEKVKKSENITWVQPISEWSMQAIPSGWQVNYVDLAQNKMCQVQAKCIIGADGPHSMVKKSLAISDSIFDYGHIATIANIRLTQPHHYIAYERFTQAGGALALLPYGHDNQMTLVLTASAPFANIYSTLSNQDLLVALNAMIGKRVVFDIVSDIMQVPLGMKIATQQTGRRAILMGNAAHLLHPIAAQGFNLSIQDIECLIQQLALYPKEEIGSAAMLFNYEQARSAPQRQTIQATDKIARYYASQQLPGWLKGASLFMLENMPVKQYFTQKSMGIS